MAYVCTWPPVMDLEETEGLRMMMIAEHKFPGGGGGHPYETEGDARRKF